MSAAAELRDTVALHDAWCSDPCEPSALGAFARRAAELRRVQDDALVVPDPATEPVTVAQLDAEPTPIWDALIRERPNPLPLPGTPRIYLADLLA